MIKTFVLKTVILFSSFGLLLILSLPGNALSVNYNTEFTNETDSLKVLVAGCPTDTCKFKILSDFFWQYANTDLERVRSIGELAFEEIRNSKDLRSLSDGYDIKGFIYREDYNLDSAKTCFGKALFYSKEVGYKYRIAWSYFHLGEINYLFGNYDIALENMKSAKKSFHEMGLSGETGKSIYFISDMYDRLGIYDSVIVYYNYKLALDISNADTASEIISSLSISQFYKSRNESIKSLEYLKNALKKAEILNNPKTLTSVYQAIGDFFVEQKRNYTIGQHYYNKVLEIAETYDLKWLKASLYNQIGSIYLNEGDDSLALEFNLKSLKLAKELKHRHSMSNAYRSLGFIYKKLGDYPSALSCFKTCYETGCNTCPLIKFHGALIEIGNIYLLSNNFKESLLWYEKSLALAEKFESLQDIALSKFMIGNYYRKLNQSTTAESFYLQSLKLAKETNNISLTRNIADTLSSFYTFRNDYNSAYNYTLLAKVMSDRLFEIDRQADVTELEMKFEFEKIKKENEAKLALSAEEIKKQKIYRNASIVIAILLVALGSIIFISYRRKKRDNRLLNDQKNQIEKKNLEIQAKVEEITIRNNEIEIISKELHESDEMKLRFFSNISHEFRTPLTLIINPVQNLLKSFTGNRDDKKQLEYIYNNAKKLNDLTNQIMDLQKLDSGNLQLNPEKADIIEYCLGVTSSFESLCHKKNNTIRFSANHQHVIVLFDKDKVGKILTNLMSNAFKFCYDNSVIEISIKISDCRFNLSIADKGIGISDDQIDNVFTRYYQVPSEYQATGTGIGLAYVKELVGFMKGNVSIESVVKDGTKINVSIPVGECVISGLGDYIIDIPKTTSRSNNALFDINEFITEDKYENTALIVEDNDELRTYINDLLKTSFNVILAKNGTDGLHTAIRLVPDIIVSDVMMPGTDGFELCALLKKDERTSHIPVILLTAMDSVQNSLDGYRTGADDYIIKPFNDELLKLKINNIISTREASRKQFDFKSLLTPEGLKIGNTDKEFMRKCLSSIGKHVDNSDFSVDRLAEELAFSNRNLYRKIKALTNLTPAELIRVYRLCFARQLLYNSNMKVFEIAMAVGYEDTNKFRQAFKKQFGTSPTESIKNIVN